MALRLSFRLSSGLSTGLSTGLSAGLALSLLAAGAAGAVATAHAAATQPASAALQSAVARTPTDVATAAFDGVVEAVRQTRVATQVPGAIVQILVKAGDRVSAGQVLVRVDAQTASQNAAAADAQGLAARAAFDVAAKDFERQKQLATAHFISPAALERAESVLRASQAQRW
jgi:multidrug efflux pump subunit AcrA (membrane-fusion protein)